MKLLSNILVAMALVGVLIGLIIGHFVDSIIVFVGIVLFMYISRHYKEEKK